MLEVKNLSAKVVDTDQNILNDLSLKINSGEIHAIMGPNGTGKSTLSKVIMGHYSYEVTSGDILVDGESIKDLEVDERARKGIFLCMQDPTVIEGVSNSEFIRTALNEKNNTSVNLYTFIKEMEKEMENLSLDASMLHRSLNSGFSGGEKKKNEVLQLKSLKPKYIILDEIDSGLDVDSLKVVCENIVEYLSENKDASVLIITHYPRILEYIKPDFVHVLSDGKIQMTGDMNLALDIEKNGYNMIGNDNNE